jgi:hypothetical protein
MLVACDEAVQQRSEQSIWLHVRQSDPAAQQLYAGFDYREQDRDKPKVGFFGFGGSSSKGSPRILLRRQLANTPKSS